MLLASPIDLPCLAFSPLKSKNFTEQAFGKAMRHWEQLGGLRVIVQSIGGTELESQHYIKKKKKIQSRHRQISAIPALGQNQVTSSPGRPHLKILSILRSAVYPHALTWNTILIRSVLLPLPLLVFLRRGVM